MYRNPIYLLFAVFIIIFLSSQAVTAQIEDLREDAEFFYKQKDIYQRWLDTSGIGKVLHVETIDVKEQQLSLYLGFAYSDIDSIVRAWEMLKRAFETERAITLEQQLFYKAVNLMEVRQSLVDVQVYDTYDLRKEPLFFRGIYFEGGEVKVEASNPKSKIREVEFEASDFPKRGAEGNFRKDYSAQKVFEIIYQYAQDKYGAQKCPDRKAKVVPLERSKKTLRFEVVNLCLEVLKDEGVVCPIMRRLGIDCNWAKRELLTFTITFTETTGGFQLNIMLDGKYGSALYENIRRGGYMNMEFDFDEELDRYADQFKEELRAEILK
ncbi:MAG: hypothetical protein MI974_08295 [Chitinophagales bacterium]|nr:hypothetical protein [Chitinophagales bacterium]